MIFNGSGLIGDSELNDYSKEQMEKNAQSEELKKYIAADVELKKQLFAAYLQHSFAIPTLSQDQQTLSDNITNHFDGQAKSALKYRLSDNINKSSFLRSHFDLFVSQFSTEK